MNKVEHLLVCLNEECSEIQKEISKALRFGLNDKWNGDLSTAEKLIHECYDFFAVFRMLIDAGIIPNTMPHVEAGLIKRKKERVLEYMEYARNRGTLK